MVEYLIAQKFKNHFKMGDKFKYEHRWYTVVKFVDYFMEALPDLPVCENAEKFVMTEDMLNYLLLKNERKRVR